jgi:hypothetical protein
MNAGISKYLSVITLIKNRLYSLIKRHRLSGWNKKTRLNNLMSTRHLKRHTNEKGKAGKGWHTESESKQE